MLDVALLGTGGSMPMPNRFLTSLIMKYKGRNILIDSGEGTQVSMRLLKWGFKTIDIICITHRHGDHILGLAGLLSTIGNSGRIEPITIIGPSGIKAIIEGMQLAIPNLPFQLNIIEAPEKSLNIGLGKEGLLVKSISEDMPVDAEMKISILDLDHSVPCIGYSFEIPRRSEFKLEKAIENNIPKELWKRLQFGETVRCDGKVYLPDMVLGKERKGIKLSYIMDTRPIDNIVSFINKSDIFICEGTYGDDGDLDKAVKYKHMTFREAGELAYRGNVDRLVIAHFSPAMDEAELYLENAKEVFENTIIGYDRMTMAVNFDKDGKDKS